MKYFLDSDDGHWYIVEENSRKQWNKWRNLNSDDEKSWVTPKFAKSIGGAPNNVIFENPIND